MTGFLDFNKYRGKGLWIQIPKLTVKKSNNKTKQKQISINILIENPKTQNKNESNLNLSIILCFKSLKQKTNQTST